jgi:hypothetical protein
MLRAVHALTLILFLGATADESPHQLPAVEEVPWDRLREHCGRLLSALEELKAPLPAEARNAVKALLKEQPKDAAAAAERVQTLLDPYCLAAVTINPESRVKAVRGPAAAELHQNRRQVFLIKVLNEAGVTHPLRVTPTPPPSQQDCDARPWLTAVVHDRPHKKLHGDMLEYVILRLTAGESGKREATLRFDVGQGTQDLGFRADVPILFTVQP